MEKKQELEELIRNLRIGDQIKLSDARQQRRALEAAKTLFKAGVISFKLHTYADGAGGFTGVAIGKGGK